MFRSVITCLSDHAEEVSSRSEAGHEEVDDPQLQDEENIPGIEMNENGTCYIAHSLHVGCFPLCVQYIVFLIRASNSQKLCVSKKRLR